MVDFDRAARDYEEGLDSCLRFAGEGSRALVEHKIELLARFWRERALPPAGALLDLGCGIGRSLAFVLKHLPGVQYTGADPSAESIRIARGQPGSLEGARFFVQDGTRLELETGSFDVVFAANVLHHVPLSERGAFYAEARRVLRPGGFFFVVEHNPWNPLTQWIVQSCPLDDDARLLQPHDLAAALRRAGFGRPRRGYVLFAPRTVRERLPWLEERLAGLALGAQYWLAAPRPRVAPAGGEG